jgi:electron transfer flavoprotein alpha subunit
MSGIFIYSDQAKIAAGLVGFAKHSGKEAFVITFSEKSAEELKNIGAKTVYLLSGDSSLPENYSKALAQFLLKNEAELFAVGATARGRDIAARVAGYLDCGMVSEASKIRFVEDQLITEKSLFGGLVVQTEALKGLSVVTMSAGNYETCQSSGEVVPVHVQSDNRVTVTNTAPLVEDKVDLSSADKIVCVGMGLDEEADLEMARKLAKVIGGELACTRSIAEDRKWLPVSSYIGISGAIVKPRLYLSMGVSGQAQHVFGIRDAKVIVGVNTNENAPIFRAADYGIVGDMYDVVPVLIKELEQG